MFSDYVRETEENDGKHLDSMGVLIVPSLTIVFHLGVGYSDS